MKLLLLYISPLNKPQGMISVFFASKFPESIDVKYCFIIKPRCNKKILGVFEHYAVNLGSNFTPSRDGNTYFARRGGIVL